MKINHLKLKAMRQSLGLTVAEACELVPNLKGEPVSKRFFQYLEAGERPISDEIDGVFYGLATQYTLLLELLNRDIEQFHKDNPRPQTDNADEYFEKMKSVKKLVLPFFHSFDDFATATGNKSPAYWKIWQAVVGHLVLVGKLNHLDDNVQIPADYQCMRWLHGKYDVSELD